MVTTRYMHRRGGAYVLVLVMSALVAVLGVGGLMARDTGLATVDRRADSGAARMLARSAVELGVQSLVDGADLSKVAPGDAFVDLAIGDGRVRALRMSEVTPGVVTVRGEGTLGDARAMLEVDVSAVVGYRERALALDPRMHWPLDEAADEVSGGATELVSGRDGVYMDWTYVAEMETGPDGGPAPRFDDTNDPVWVGDHSDFRRNNASVAFWMLSLADDDAPRSAVSKDDTGFGDGGQFSVFLWFNSVYAILESADDWKMVSGPAVPVGVWTHVVMTCGGDGFTLYVNGERTQRRGGWTVDLSRQPGDVRDRGDGVSDDGGPVEPSYWIGSGGELL
jgi:hypothetical protein